MCCGVVLMSVVVFVLVCCWSLFIGRFVWIWLCVWVFFGIGVLVGVFSGLLGVGGGFFIVFLLVK